MENRRRRGYNRPKVMCRYGAECRHFCSVIRASGKQRDLEHVERFDHPAHVETDNEKMFRAIRAGKNEEILRMLHDPDYHMDSKSNPPKYAYSVSEEIQSRGRLPYADPGAIELKRQQRDFGFDSILQYIVQYCDISVFLLALERPDTVIDLSTVLATSRKKDIRFLEAIGKESVEKFLHTDFPCSQNIDPLKSSGSRLEDNPNDYVINYGKIVYSVVNSREKNPEVFNLVHSWGLITEEDLAW